jgi:hypothetical protein
MRIYLATGLLLAVALHAAEPLRFESGSARVSLIELFTSEGCSSCPPADLWLGSLRGDPGLWREFVPVEFHVNYWDRLGWKDRLSTGEFTAREYAYASAWGSNGVYTPCFVRNGSPWRPPRGAPAGPSGPGATPGVLSVEVGVDGVCAARFTPGPDAGPAPAGHDIHLALLAGGISSRVTAGENRGQTLSHEFVVLGTADKALSKDAGSPTERAAVALPHPIAAGATRRALAAWVTRRGELAPLQATGGWLSQP